MNASPTHASPPAPFVQRRARWPFVPRQAARLGAIAAITAVLGGCVGFTEPVPSLPGSTIDPSPYIGPWSIEPSTSIVIEAAGDGTGTLTATARDMMDGEPDGPPSSFSVVLSHVNGRVIASVRADEDMGFDEPPWTILSLTLPDDGTRLIIRGLDADGIAAAVASGDLPGRQVEQDSADGMFGAVVIEADGGAVLEYLRRSPDVFIGADEVVLVRGDPQTVVESNAPDEDFFPYASAAAAEADVYRMPQPRPPDPGSHGYPAMPTLAPDWLPPTEFERSSPGMAFPEGSPTPFGATDATMFGTRPGAAADAGMPAPVKGILTALGLLIVVGIVVAAALDAVQKRRWARGTTVAGSDEDPTMRAADGTDGAGDRRLSPFAALRRNAWPALLVLVIAVGPLLYLGVLLGSLAFPSWIVLQPGVQAMLHSLAPYVLVFSIGALIAVAEVVTTFPAFAAEALGTKWATVLVAFNALGTTIAYSAVVTYASNHDHPLLRALAIAAGVAVLLRTRFVLARDLGGRGAGKGAGAGAGTSVGERGRADGGDGVSIDLGWPYARIQQLCRQRIDRELLRDPRYATSRLLALFPDTAKLQQFAADSVRTRDPSESADLRARLDAIVVDGMDPGIVRARIARFIVATGGLGHTVFVIDHAEADGTS